MNIDDFAINLMQDVHKLIVVVREGKYKSRELSLVLTKLEEAWLWASMVK